jgi:hypothetical protein
LPSLENPKIHPHDSEKTAFAIDLPKASQTGQSLAALPMTWQEHLILVQDTGTRSDQAHLATEHVDYLRQLIQSAVPQPQTSANRLGITEIVEFRHRAFGSHQLIQVLPMHVRLGVDGHGPEFQAETCLAQMTYALLLEQNRAARNNLNENSYEQAGRHPTNRRGKNTT